MNLHSLINSQEGPEHLGEFIMVTCNVNVINLLVCLSGEAAAEKDSEITFIRKATCGNADLQKGRQYLIMGKEALQIKHNFSFK